jgi:hypothetical protein
MPPDLRISGFYGSIGTDSDRPAAKARLNATRRTEMGLIEVGGHFSHVNVDTIDQESDILQALEDCKNRVTFWKLHAIV